MYNNWIQFLRVSSIVIAIHSTFYFLIETVIKMFWVKKREQFRISTAPTLQWICCYAICEFVVWVTIDNLFQREQSPKGLVRMSLSANGRTDRNKTITKSYFSEWQARDAQR
jgi:hypothetical protein